MDHLNAVMPSLDYLIPQTYVAVSLSDFETRAGMVIPTLQLMDPARQYNGLAMINVCSPTHFWYFGDQARLSDKLTTLDLIALDPSLEHGLEFDRVSLLYRPRDEKVWLYDHTLAKHLQKNGRIPAWLKECFV